LMPFFFLNDASELAAPLLILLVRYREVKKKKREKGKSA